MRCLLAGEAFPLSGTFIPESLYISKESFLSFNKLNVFPRVLFFFFKNLGSQWRGEKKIPNLLGKKCTKTKDQARDERCSEHKKTLILIGDFSPCGIVIDYQLIGLGFY